MAAVSAQRANPQTEAQNTNTQPTSHQQTFNEGGGGTQNTNRRTLSSQQTKPISNAMRTRLTTINLLKAVTDKRIDTFLDSPPAVRELVECFQKPRDCPSKNIQTIVRK